MSMTDETAKFDPNDIQASKGMAWLSYLGIFFLIPMLTQKDSAFAKFHVNQGVVLFIASIIFNIVGYIIMFVMALILPALAFIGYLICLVPAVFAIMGIIFALQGSAKRLPLIGNMQIIK